MWEGKYKEEVTKTEPLEEVCGELRDELDMAHKQRLDAFEIKMKPIVVREGPSRKVGGRAALRLEKPSPCLHQSCLFSN